MAKRKVSGKKTTSPKLSLMTSVERGDIAGVHAAISAGIKLLDEMEDTSPLALAVEKGNFEMVQTLLDLGHDPNMGGIVVPLAEAASQGDIRMLNLLLERGARVDEPGEEGETAVMWAAAAGHLDILNRLIEAGADLKLGDSEGLDALDYAMNGRKAKAIEFLLPNYPKARKDKVNRQSHLWRNDQKKATSPRSQQKEAKSPAPKNRPVKAESLVQAFRDGKQDKFLKLLADGADPNETNEMGVTILTSVAASSAVYTLMEPLLKAGADPSRGELFRPLPRASMTGVKSVLMLLKSGADPNLSEPNGFTPLMGAALHGDEESVRALLDAGADPNAEDKDGHDALWYALDRNNEPVAKLLRPLTADAVDARMPWRKNTKRKSRELCLFDAVKAGDRDFVQKCLTEDATVDVADESGNTPLHCATENNDIEMIRLFLEAGASLEAEGCGDLTPLQTAAREGHLQAVKLFLNAKANVHAGDDDILCYACENEDSLDVIDLLLSSGATVNVVGGWRDVTPLHVAAEKNQPLVVERLLKAGADINVQDNNGRTPFLNAALRADIKTVQLLIDAGSDIKAIDSKRRNAYDLASSWGEPETAEFLKSLLGIR